MPSKPTNARMPWRDSKYKAELKVIQMYKEDFISEMTKTGRVHILRNGILPVMFKYWKSIGAAPEEGAAHNACAKYTSKRIEDAARAQWKEMGVMSVTFTAYTGPDGKLVIDAHDHIADVTGITTSPFVDSYRNEVSHMKRLLMQYVKKVQSTANPLVPIAPTPCRNEDDSKIISLNRTADGFPILPNPWKTGNYTKKQLDQLWSLYVNQHYKLANGGRSRKVPYKAISADTSHFIMPECLPAEFVLKDPSLTIAVMVEDILQPAKYPGCADADADADFNITCKAGASAKAANRHNMKTKQKSHIPTMYQSITPPGQTDKELYFSGLPRSSEDEMAGLLHSGAGAEANPTAQHNKGKQKSHMHKNQSMPQNTALSAEADMAGPPCFGTNSLLQTPPMAMEPGYIIDQSGMDALIKAGLIPMPMPMPINGPADGVPQYVVDAVAHERL
ncbi:hypothetical protein JOM56_012976 [Amanita muscaria]